MSYKKDGTSMSFFRINLAMILLMGVVLFGTPNVSADQIRAPKRQILSVNFYSSNMKMVEVDALSTYLVTLPLETGIESLRIGLANTTPVPYRLGGIAFCESNLWQPKPKPGWAYIRFSGVHSGATPSGPKPVVVPGNTANATGATDVPAIIWSDWVNYRTVETGARPQILFRVLVSAQTMPMVFTGGPSKLADPHAAGQARLRGEMVAYGDYVHDLDLPLTTKKPTEFSPIFVIQYRALSPGIQIVMGGDSHLSSWKTFAQLAAIDLSTPREPISVWNTAWGGKTPDTFWPSLDEAIDDARPSITLIQGWSANGKKPDRDQVYLTRVQETAQRTMAQGGIPVILKGLPRKLFGKKELANWQQINIQLDTLVPAALVFDPDPYVEDPQRPGDWLPEFSRDGIHPNVQGNEELKGPFERLMMPLIDEDQPKQEGR